MMVLYIDTSVFYHAYCPVEQSDLADRVLEQISEDFPACSSEWTIIEMFRAMKKQVNLKNIVEEDAQAIIDHFLAEIHDWQQTNALVLVPVTARSIVAARDVIFSRNLYAADAIHLLSAVKMKSAAFLTFDRDFRGDVNGIPIINQDTEEFMKTVVSLNTGGGRRKSNEDGRA